MSVPEASKIWKFPIPLDFGLLRLFLYKHFAMFEIKLTIFVDLFLFSPWNCYSFVLHMRSSDQLLSAC